MTWPRLSETRMPVSERPAHRERPAYIVRPACVVWNLVRLLAATAAAQEGPWSQPDCDARVALVVEGDLYRRDDALAEAVVDFEQLLAPGRILAADSLVLVDQVGRTVSVELAEDARTRHTSGNPRLRLRWPCGRLAPFEDRTWHLYFRTATAGAPTAWRRLETTFDPEQAGVVYATSFEEPEPGRPQQPHGLSPAGRDQAGEHTDRSWADGEAHAGRRSLKIARTLDGPPPPNSNRPHWRTWPPPLEVRPGETYQMSGWLKCARIKDDAGTSVSLLFLDEGQRRLPEPRVRLESSRREHDWTRFSTSAVAPAEARYVEISFSLHKDGEVYLDDLELSLVAGSRVPPPVVQVGRLAERRP